MEYLKYIVILGFLAFKFLNSGKKTQETPQKRSNPPKRNPSSENSKSLEDILRELAGEPAPAKKEILPAPVTASSSMVRGQNKQIEIEDHQHDFRPEYEHHADTGPSISSIRTEIAEDQNLKEYEDVDFDLRQAIIAQTLLTRPEY